MKATTEEWVKKAEADFRSAGREMRVRKSPNYDLVCFCTQQCREKYLKALLGHRGRPTPKTHDLAKLLHLLKNEYPETALLLPVAEGLSEFAAAFRYPGSSASKELARQALQGCGLVRDIARQLLGLSNGGKARR